MADQNSQLSDPTQPGIPAKWQEKFIIKRIGEEDIEISLQERNALLQNLERGQKYIQIGKYTLMLNGIKSIDPKWGEKNIPPKPKEQMKYWEENGKMLSEITNQAEIDEWNRIFGEQTAKEIKEKIFSKN